MVGVAVMDGYCCSIGPERTEVKGRETAEAILAGMLTFAVVGGLLKLRSWTRVFIVREVCRIEDYGRELEGGVGAVGGIWGGLAGTGSIRTNN